MKLYVVGLIALFILFFYDCGFLFSFVETSPMETMPILPLDWELGYLNIKFIYLIPVILIGPEFVLVQIRAISRVEQVCQGGLTHYHFVQAIKKSQHYR